MVDGTQRKYQLGTSTLFEVIQQRINLATARQNVKLRHKSLDANAKLSMDLATGSHDGQHTTSTSTKPRTARSPAALTPSRTW